MITITYPDGKTATATITADVSNYLSIVNKRLAETKRGGTNPLSTENAALGVDLAAADFLIAALHEYKEKRASDASTSQSKAILSIPEVTA